MITSKQNLLLVDLTRVDKNIPVLDCVNVLSDGTTVAGNGRSFMIVSKVDKDIQERLRKIYGDNKSERVNVSSMTIREVLKNLPADRKYGGMLEHADIVSKDGKKVQFTIYDGARKRSIDGRVNPSTYPPFEKLFSRALNNKQKIKLVLNAKRLLSLLETIVKCSGDTSDFSPIYVEFTTENEMIVRMTNPKTNQECIGLMLPYTENEAPWTDSLQLEERLQYGFENDGNKQFNRNDEKSSELDNNSFYNSRNYKFGNTDNLDSDNRTNNRVFKKRGKAKKTGKRALAQIIEEICPECGKYHLASDGKAKWCSCVRGCNYYEKINKK